MSLMRVERTTFRLGGECSIQLSYRLKKIDSHSKKKQKIVQASRTHDLLVR